uniref:protein-tyrosine-phosphatase n=1 Tax=Callorhinchus milii TaxID=7868 RepID=A0A4W3JYS3_CALMI
MTSRFRMLGGRTNNMRAFEIPRDKHRSEVICNVHFLNSSIQSFKVNKQDAGQVLLDMAYNHLGLTEREYFSLQFIDDSVDCPRWLEPNKPIRKQLKGGSPCSLNFRVRFFVTDPSALQQEQTSMCVYRLSCPHNIAVVLASYAVQAELGEYNPPKHHHGYIADFCFGPDQNQEFETKVMLLHKQHSDLEQSEAELYYLSRAKALEFYGVELHKARVSLLRQSQESIVGFNMLNYRACKILWKSCVEHHTFFQAKKPLLQEKKILAAYFTVGHRNQNRSVCFCSSYLQNTVKPLYSISLLRKSLSVEQLETRSLPSPSWTHSITSHPLFYFQGGVDQKMPLIVSRVSLGSPADTCTPKLIEGDQILLINGRDISEHTHDQVVMFIKASRESHSRELLLLVRRKVYVLRYETDLQYFPNNSKRVSYPEYGDSLEESMIQLRKGLESGAILNQFDQLYRKKPGMAITCAKLPQNMDKNRYKDVLPYDVTRVVLDGSEDYINANYVNMEVSGTSILNRYIACQGPLPHTCPYFWQTIWNQQSSLVVMLTTLTERGRVKCHQYWPDLQDVCKYGNFQVTCHTENYGIAYVFREMMLTNLETGEERDVCHLQYVTWPDHGVPDDSTDFFDFVTRVRQKRIKRENEPVIVHCSAGIGRTGVLVAMETATCLIENNQPVYPLDIVRTMRDQRAMMVQTSSQYKFVCEAILRVYEEGVIQPSEVCWAAG